MKNMWMFVIGLLLLGIASFSVSFFYFSVHSAKPAIHVMQRQESKLTETNAVQKRPAPKTIYTVIQPTPQQISEANAKYQAYLDQLKTVPGKQIGSFRTSLNGDNASGRVQNIRLACKKITATVLMPGEQFSFNQTTGDSNNPANGWQHAIEIDNNKLVDGYGGGICQVSTTIYNAVAQAGLQVDERHVHSLTVPYIAHGKDATVDYPDLDFKFTNSLQTPVRIQTQVNGNDVICTLYALPSGLLETH